MEFLMTKTIVMEFFVLICPLCGQANERIVFVEGFSSLFSIVTGSFKPSGLFPPALQK